MVFKKGTQEPSLPSSRSPASVASSTLKTQKAAPNTTSSSDPRIAVSKAGAGTVDAILNGMAQLNSQKARGKASPEFYHRAGELVWHVSGGHLQTPTDSSVTTTGLTRWFRVHGGVKGSTKDEVAAGVAKSLLCDSRKKVILPELRTTLTHPVVTMNATGQYEVFSKQGYDPYNKVFFNVPANLQGLEQDVLAWPNTKAAVDFVLNDLLYDFTNKGRFPEQRDVAHYLAMLVQPYVRGIVGFDNPTPMWFIKAEGAGGGKGTLVGFHVAIVSGESKIAPVQFKFTEANEAELQKQLVGLGRQQPEYVVLDNLRDTLSTQSGESMITEGSFSARPLYTDEQVKYPIYWQWIATGNQPDANQDMARRIVIITVRKESGEQQPVYRWDVPRILNERRLIMSALVRIAIDGLHAPCDVPVPRFDKFEQWAKVMHQILTHAGVPGFDPAYFVREGGSYSATQREQFARTVFEQFGSHPQSATALLNLLSNNLEIELPGLGSNPTPGTFGKWLSRTDQDFGYYKLRKDDKNAHKNSNVYWFEPKADRPDPYLSTNKTTPTAQTEVHHDIDHIK